MADQSKKPHANLTKFYVLEEIFCNFLNFGDTEKTHYNLING
jgi:hypothetical protein